MKRHKILRIKCPKCKRTLGVKERFFKVPKSWKLMPFIPIFKSCKYCGYSFRALYDTKKNKVILKKRKR